MTMSIAMKIIPLKGIHLQKSTSKLFLERMFHTKWHELFGFTSQRKKTSCIQVNFNFRKGVHKARLIEPCVQLKEQLDLCSICDFQSLGLIEWSSLATICRASWICWHLQIHQLEPSKKLKPPHVSKELDEFSCMTGNVSHLISFCKRCSHIKYEIVVEWLKTHGMKSYSQKGLLTWSMWSTTEKEIWSFAFYLFPPQSVTSCERDLIWWEGSSQQGF